MSSRMWVITSIALVITFFAGASRIALQQTGSEAARARAVLNDFMQARLARDDTKVRTFLAVDYHRQYVDQSKISLIGNVDPHYHRYRIESLTPSANGTWIAQVRIEERQQGFMPAGWFTETIFISQIDGSYRISSVTPSTYEASG